MRLRFVDVACDLIRDIDGHVPEYLARLDIDHDVIACGCSASTVLLSLVWVTRSAFSTSDEGIKSFGSAACATGGFDEALLVVVAGAAAVVDDDEVPARWSLPQAATNIPPEAIATIAVRWRTLDCLSA